MYQVHDFKWDNASVERFWDYYARQNKIAYFAQLVGSEVLKVAQKHIPLQGHVLDYGCGKGHLIGKFLEHGLTSVYGADFSADSVNHVKKQYGSSSGFKDAYVLSELPAPELKAGFFNAVFLLETIEHLIPPFLHETFTEVARVVQKGGYIVVTTPSNEDLEMQKVLCPNCGAHFHKVQHVNTFNEQSITELLAAHGFEKIYCDSIHLEGYFTPRKRLARMAKKVAGIKAPGVNLVYIGRKK